MLSPKRIVVLLVLVVSSWWGAAHAVLTIDITGGQEGALPIAIVPFGWDLAGATPPQDIAAIVSADLRRSGRFAPLPERELLTRPHDASEVNFADWRLVGSDNLVVGRVSPAAAGRYRVEFQLLDVFRGAQLIGVGFDASVEQLRGVAHRISDLIYEKLTGERGAFNTTIAYVVATPAQGLHTRYALQVADADGYNAQTILASPEPIMSPAWSPDGMRLAYVSFEQGRSQVYVQDLLSGRREAVAAYPGINSAPAWSPDGAQLAMTLSKDGSPDIYVMDLGSRSLRRITDNLAIDTEAAWSPDGATLVFTSDRGGSPQLYQVSASGGREKRLTFEGRYNARATFSPDGRRLALVHGTGAVNHIAVLELDGGALQVLSKGNLDESPSFAPNGSMIIYATEDQGRDVLAVVSVDGRIHQRIALQEGDIREPAWSPFKTKTEE